MPGKAGSRDDQVRRVATVVHRRLKKKAAELKAEGGSQETGNARRALRAVATRLKKVIATLQSRT